jgi:hypothetical protein
VLDDKFDSKFTLMLDDGGVEEFAQGGCWTVCHQDSDRMPEAKNRKIEKYLSHSRKKIVKKVGGGTNYKDDSEIQAMLTSGYYLEFWQMQLNPGSAPSFIDGYISKERIINDNTVVSGSAKEEGNKWVVEFVRPLKGDAPHKNLTEGKQYNLGFALHDQSVEGRYHVVSLEYSMSLGGDALIKAVKQ